MKVKHIVEWLNAIAPFESAESFDNVGLLMGDRETDLTQLLVCMDVTDDVADEAIVRGCELIIAHHPFIFHALRRIDYTGPQGRTLCRLAEHRISVIAVHTNWDKAPGGVSDSLAETLGLQSIVNGDDYVRIGTLPSPLSSDDFAALLREKLNIIPRCYPASERPISRVAVAGGAYGEGYEIAKAFDAQAFVVGEVAHHEILDACARGLTVYDAGHFATEIPGIRALYQRFLADALKAGWPVQAHLYDKAPFAGAILA